MLTLVFFNVIYRYIRKKGGLILTYIILLILAHYIGDYALQNSYIAAFKSKDNYVLFAHCAIWTFVMTVVSNWIGLVDIHSSSDIIIVVFVLLIPHIIIDYIKGCGVLAHSARKLG